MSTCGTKNPFLMIIFNVNDKVYYTLMSKIELWVLGSTENPSEITMFIIEDKVYGTLISKIKLWILVVLKIHSWLLYLMSKI